MLLYIHRNHRLIRYGSPGRPPRLSHSSWALKAWFNTAFHFKFKFTHTLFSSLERCVIYKLFKTALSVMFINYLLWWWWCCKSNFKRYSCSAERHQILFFFFDFVAVSEKVSSQYRVRFFVLRKASLSRAAPHSLQTNSLHWLNFYSCCLGSVFLLLWSVAWFVSVSDLISSHHAHREDV